MKEVVFLFGEAEKGAYCTPFICRSLAHLSDVFGDPPENSLGLFYAIQSILYGRELIYFRVKEEGFSRDDYFKGLQLLRTQVLPQPISAICLPGMGDRMIIEAATAPCALYKSFLIITQSDFYDFLTGNL